MTAKLTDHSYDMSKKRLGLGKKTADKEAEKALKYGLKHCETKGNLRKYLDKEYLAYCSGNNMRVYHRNLYVFRGSRLITVFHLPNNLCNLADKLQKEKDKLRDEKTKHTNNDNMEGIELCQS